MNLIRNLREEDLKEYERKKGVYIRVGPDDQWRLHDLIENGYNPNWNTTEGYLSHGGSFYFEVSRTPGILLRVYRGGFLFIKYEIFFNRSIRIRIGYMDCGLWSEFLSDHTLSADYLALVIQDAWKHYKIRKQFREWLYRPGNPGYVSALNDYIDISGHRSQNIHERRQIQES